MPIKVKAPRADITSINVDGVEYKANAKGIFSLPDGTDPAQLSPFGFESVSGDTEPTKPAPAPAPAADAATAEQQPAA